MTEPLPLQARDADPLIGSLMDAPVVTAVARDGELETELYAVERRAVQDAVPARRREFRTGRACARRCLERLGRPPGPIGCGPRGEPLWPTGVVGSITHCAGLRACAVAPAAAVRALGIDAEPNAPLPDGVAEVIATAAERDALPTDRTPVAWDRLLFSAKEAAIKVWYALQGRVLSLEDTRVELDVACGAFRVRAPGMPGALHGRWAADTRHVATAIVLAG